MSWPSMYQRFMAERRVSLVPGSVLLALIVALLVCSACASNVDESSPLDSQGSSSGAADTTSTGGAQDAPGTLPSGSPVVPEPGVYELDDGRIQAVGMLGKVDLEGGFWAVVEPSPDSSASGLAESVLVVIANPEEYLPELANLQDSYVSVTGTPFEGVSTRMAGPEVLVDGIEDLGDPAE